MHRFMLQQCLNIRTQCRNRCHGDDQSLRAVFTLKSHPRGWQNDRPDGGDLSSWLKGSIQLFFSVSFDGAIRRGVSHTGQNEASFNLVIVQEALVRLINGACSDFACASGTSACTAGVRKIDALLFSSIEDVLIVRNFDGLVEAFALADQGDLIRSHGWR